MFPGEKGPSYNLQNGRCRGWRVETVKTVSSNNRCMTFSYGRAGGPPHRITFHVCFREAKWKSESRVLSEKVTRWWKQGSGEYCSCTENAPYQKDKSGFLSQWRNVLGGLSEIHLTSIQVILPIYFGKSAPNIIIGVIHGWYTGESTCRSLVWGRPL